MHQNLLAHPLVARVQDQVGVILGEAALRELGQALVQALLMALIVDAAKLKLISPVRFAMER